MVTKHCYSAFIIPILKIEDLVITGIMTNMCCESTVQDAYFRDY
ncbi:MAG: isochorismatase family protein [candidate division WOR-3 bacterium]|nr:isochorismatase family protein [candidate division WOR-3 bacterium]MCX7837213.1 isochorismatase family protein [candidate division WOR-3 bacterium]MDW8114605.1 isochorismatase family protein [candidate division WOR-3 bacterium]